MRTKTKYTVASIATVLCAGLASGCEEDLETVYFKTIASSPAYITMQDGNKYVGYERYVMETAKEAHRWCEKHDRDERFGGVYREANWIITFDCLPK